jgi:hypothetical protein
MSVYQWAVGTRADFSFWKDQWISFMKASQMVPRTTQPPIQQTPGDVHIPYPVMMEIKVE